jgi:hypothetical protein
MSQSAPLAARHGTVLLRGGCLPLELAMLVAAAGLLSPASAGFAAQGGAGHTLPHGSISFAPQDVSAPVLMPTARHYNVCCFTTSMSAVDLTGSGRLDLVTGNGMSYDVSVLLSDGAGGYAEPFSLPLDNFTNGYVAVATGDVTGDGHADIVATGFNANEVVVFPGDGAGGFGDAQHYTIGNAQTPRAVALADVNGDGHPDIVTANGDSGNISVLLGNGQGGFAAATNFAAGSFPNALAIGDLNGDGHADVVTANGEGYDVSVLLGDGAGHFAAPANLSIGPDAEPRAIAIGDVTGDGHADIVTANAALDGSSFPPPELPGTVSVLAGDGAGGFAAAVQLSAGSGEGRADGIALGDVTGDGRTDIVVSRPNANSAALIAADGTGGFAPAVILPTSVGPSPVLIADVTGDGHADVVTGNAVSANISILPGDGAGHVGFGGVFGAGRYAHSVVSADFNGDGRADIATSNLMSSDVSVLLNDGKGGFLPEVRHAVGNSPSWITSGDVNGDGKIDLITANLGAGTVSVLLGDGHGGFTAAQDFSIGEGFQSPYAVTLGDANGDGKLDIATANTNISNDSISVLLGDGTGQFGPATLLQVGSQGIFNPQSIVLTDVTGDGHADIVTANLNADNLSLLVGDGSGHFADAVHIPTGPGPTMVVAADVTGDGKIDLVVLNQPEQAVEVLTGDGTGGFSIPSSYPIYPDVEQMDFKPWPWGLAVADIDGDGKLDIITANTQNDTVSVLPNDGHGGFNTYYWFATGAHPGSVAIADIDGDGKPDVITSNRQNDDIAVLYNRGATGDRIFKDGFEAP